MRLFNLFLRRAGVQTMPAGIVKKPAVSRLTLVCSRAHMGQIRKPALMSQARQLKKVEGVRDVRWGDHRHIVLN